MIETGRLRLRPCREDDKPAFATILNTPAMTAELGGVRSRAAIDALVDKRIADQSRHGFSYWAVELRDSAELIGTCGLRIASNYPGTPVEGMHEMGWRIAESHWGRGYATEAAQATLDWAWATLPVTTIAAWTTAGNRKSWRVMERLGMARAPQLDFTRSDHAPDDPVAAIRVYTIARPLSQLPGS
jgi:RimJ/RimL family protein N-acetyltransferase